MPLDLNEKDQNNQASSSSSSTLPYPILFDPHHDQQPSSTLSRTDHEEAEKILISSNRSWDYAADQRDGTSKSSLKPKEDRKYGIRVCADCHTTKTPLRRSGPTGPKSLCNACGIRQRKARRAAMTAASVNGAIIAPKARAVKGNNRLHKKQKKPQIECTRQLKKKQKKLEAKACGGRKKSGFEDFTISLRNNLAHQQVFPQDEKEAAILLMSLSYGLVHV